MKEPHFSFKNIYVISALRQSLVPALCVDGLHPQWGRQEGDRLILGHAGPERPGRSGGGDKATCAAAGIESQTPPQQSHRRRQHPGWSWRGGPLVCGPEFWSYVIMMLHVQIWEDRRGGQTWNCSSTSDECFLFFTKLFNEPSASVNHTRTHSLCILNCRNLESFFFYYLTICLIIYL